MHHVHHDAGHTALQACDAEEGRNLVTGSLVISCGVLQLHYSKQVTDA